MPRMTEGQLVGLMVDFFIQNKKKLKTVKIEGLGVEGLGELIKDSFSDEVRISPEDKINLSLAIKLQVAAYQYALSKKGEGLDDTTHQFIPENYQLKTGDALKEIKWTTTNSLLTIIGFPISAAFFVSADIVESAKELSNNQRVVANLATLCLTAAYIIGAIAIVFAIAPVTPVGWAFCTLIALTAGAALITKGVRILANSMDASFAEDSASKKDSRFRLTPKEELHLIKEGWNKDEIPKIKALIRGLAMDANPVQQYGLYSTPEDYSKITNLLKEVKKGEIPDELCEQYEINRPESDKSSETMK